MGGPNFHIAVAMQSPPAPGSRRNNLYRVGRFRATRPTASGTRPTHPRSPSARSGTPKRVPGATCALAAGAAASRRWTDLKVASRSAEARSLPKTRATRRATLRRTCSPCGSHIGSATRHCGHIESRVPTARNQLASRGAHPEVARSSQRLPYPLRSLTIDNAAAVFGAQAFILCEKSGILLYREEHPVRHILHTRVSHSRKNVLHEILHILGLPRHAPSSSRLCSAAAARYSPGACPCNRLSISSARTTIPSASLTLDVQPIRMEGSLPRSTSDCLTVAAGCSTPTIRSATPPTTSRTS